MATAAPGRRTMSMPSTPGISHTPYITACAGGNAANNGPVAFHSRFQAQNTTPETTPRTATVTMSRVRHLVM